MGFTHYFSYARGHAEFRDLWPQLVADTRTVIDAVEGLGIRIAGPFGDGYPILTADMISFNGLAPEDYEELTLSLSEATGYQPPKLPPGVTWAFCKTEHRRYDLAVTAVLLRAYTLAPRHVAISSDGNWERDWQHARDLLGELFGPVSSEYAFSQTSIGPLASWPTQ